MTIRMAAMWVLLLPAAAVGASEDTLFQVVPQVGVRVGGSLEDADSGVSRELGEAAAYGLALELRYGRDDGWLQLWYSHQGSELRTPGGLLGVDVDHLHVGGTAPISSDGRVHSHVVAGIGATRFAPAGQGLDPRTRFSGSLGLGISVPLSPRAALRVELRGYLTLVDSDTSFFCRSDFGEGACAIVASGSTLFQAELTAGIAFGL